MEMMLPSQARFVLDAPSTNTANDKAAAEETTAASTMLTDAGAPSFGRQLAEMDEGAPASVVAAERGRGGLDAGGGNRKPSAASQVALLIQALQNGKLTTLTLTC